MILVNSVNILILLLILLIFHLYIKNIIVENMQKTKGIDSILNITNNNKKIVYIFRGNKCNKYVSESLNISKDYPVTIGFEFRGIPSNITTSFKWSANEVYFIKNNKAYLYNIINNNLVKTIPSTDINQFITGNNVSVTSWINNKYIAFNGSQYTIFAKNQQSSKIQNIPHNLSFLENMDDITKWNTTKNNTTFYVFKNNSFKRFNILNNLPISDLDKLKKTDYNVNDLTNEHFQNISLLLDYSLDNHLNCPNNFTLDNDNDTICVHKEKSIKCSLTNNNILPKCENICTEPIISSDTDKIKYNEGFAILIYPNNFLGQDTNNSNINFDNTLKWTFDKNIFYCEPLDDCILKGETIPFLEYNKPFKIKNINTRKELKLDLDENNIYEFHKVNDNEIKDGTILKLCINKNINKYFKNGINDINETVTIYKVETSEPFKDHGDLNKFRNNEFNTLTKPKNYLLNDQNEIQDDSDNEENINRNQTINYDDDDSDNENLDRTDDNLYNENISKNTCKLTDNVNTINDYECYTDPKGIDYRGMQNITVNGNQCKKWSKEFVNLYKNKGISTEHNYCRNVDGKQQKPFCFIENESHKIEHCNVGEPQKKCKKDYDNKNNICNLNDCQDYSGNISISGIGTDCIKWSSVDPNLFSDMNHNYCRNPIQQLKNNAYCYTKRDKKDGWEYCNIPLNPNKCNIKENKLLAGFTIQENNIYYLFRNIYVQDKKLIAYCSVSLNNNEIKELGIVNNESWPNLQFTENIDATYYDEISKSIYFFNGPQISIYNIKSRIQENIKFISEIFPRIPVSFQNGITCIINKLENNSAFILKDNNYIDFNFSSRKSSEVYTINKLIPNLSNITLFDASISYKLNNNNICKIFKNDIFYYIDLNKNSQTYGYIDNKNINKIDKLYYNFWNIDLNSSIFNKQKIYVEDNNIYNISLFITEVNKAGGLSNYLKQTNKSIEDIVKTYNISYEELVKAAESGILSLKKKILTNPLHK